MVRVDSIFRCGQLVTPSGTDVLKGDEMSQIEAIDDAGLAVKGGIVVDVGRFGSISSRYGGRLRDLGDRLVLPGFVDSHSHLVFSGSRERELGMKLSGRSYMEILDSGGGILSTVRKTRRATGRELEKESSSRLQRMVEGGVTSFEIKSGYGLNLRDELKMLAVASGIGHGLPTVPTYLGAHALPPEKSRKDYIDEIVGRHLPEVRKRSLSAYCDIFIEKGAFTLEEARAVLSAAKKSGFMLTAHVDEFSETGGAALASELGAVSVSHLAYTPRSEFSSLAANGVTGIILPSTPLFSMGTRYPDARSMISEGMSVAIGSDLSPNSWNESLLLSCTLAVYSCRLRQEEAIAAATLNSACAIGLGKVAGSLEGGKRADFACFDIDDYRKMFYMYTPNPVHSVFSAGKKIVSNRSSLHME